MADLNSKQSRFVQEYLVDNNGTQAAIRAGYSPNTAESQASRLLRNAKVRAEVEKGQRKVAKKLEITREKLLEMANAVYEAAMAEKQLAAANGAIKELGVLSGERVERSESTIVPHEDRLASIRERVGADRPTAH